MKTYEGIIIIKWYKNDNGGDRRPLTIDAENKDDLKLKLAKIIKDFSTKGDDKDNVPSYRTYTEGQLPHSVKIEYSERL